MAGTLTTVTTGRGSMLRTSSGAVAVSVVTVLPMFLTAGLAVQIGDDLGFAPSALAVAPAAFFGAMVFASPFSGRLVERVGTVRTVRGIVLCVAVLMTLLALTVTSLPVLAAYLVGAGILNALAQPATNQLVAQRIPRTRQGFAYGAKYSAIPVASLLAGLAVPSLGLTVGWRWAFGAFAVAAVLTAMYPFGQPHSGPTSEAATASEIRLPRRILLGLALAVGFAAAGASTLAIFMVASAVHTGWSEAHAGLLLAAASALGVAARLLSGVQADRRGRNHLRVVAGMLVIGAVGTLAMATESLPLFAVGAPVAFAAGWGWPGLFILSIVSLHPEAPASATGITQVGTSAGCVIGPLTFGLLVDAFSFRVAWMGNASVLLLAACVILVCRRQVLNHLSTLPPGSIPWRQKDSQPVRQGRTT